MRRKTLMLIVFAAAVLAGPALAEEVLYFTNGTSMPIVSHTVADEMIEVVLGGGAFMAFPIDQIEKIEDGRSGIALLDGSGNKMVSTPGTTKYRIKGSVPSRHRRGSWESTQVPRSGGSRVEPDARGVASIRPFPNSHNSSKAKVTVNGRRQIYQAPVAETRAEGVIGTRRVGTKYMIPKETMPSGARKIQPIGLTARSDSGGSGEKK